MRSLRGLKPKRNKPPFRRDLRESVTYCGELPFEHRGAITDTLYIWTVRKPTVWVDKRDLPALLKAAGADDLDGEWIAEAKERKAERDKKKAERREAKRTQDKTEEVAG